MAIFKRFEVWLLLLLSIGGVWYVLWSESQTEDVREKKVKTSKTDPELPEESRFEIREVRTIEEGEDRIIEIDLLGKNDTPEPLELAPPDVILLAESGGEEAEVPSFFLPFEPPPSLTPNDRSIVTLKYWLQSDLRNPESFRLVIHGESLEIRADNGS